MAQQKDYAQIVAYIDGQYLIEVSGLTKRTENGQQPVNLLVEGLGGFAPGPGGVTVNIRYTIPASGQEFNFDKAVHEAGFHTIQPLSLIHI